MSAVNPPETRHVPQQRPRAGRLAGTHRHAQRGHEGLYSLSVSPSEGCSFFQLVLCEKVLEEFIHRPGDGC